MNTQSKWNGFYVWFFVLIAWVTVFQGAHAATLHAILAADTNDFSIGRGVKLDLEHMTHLLKSISKYTGLRLSLNTYEGDGLTNNNIKAVLDRLSPRPEDVVIFFYSGHGYRTMAKQSKWPYLFLDTPLDFDWVISALKNKKPRFFIAMSDSCNNRIDTTFIPGMTRALPRARPKTENYRQLFLNYHGYIVASGAKPGEFGWNTQWGGKFTNAFLTSLYGNLVSSNPDWHTIMDNAGRDLYVLDRQGRTRQQHPQHEINISSVPDKPVQEDTPSNNPVSEATPYDIENWLQPPYDFENWLPH